MKPVKINGFTIVETMLFLGISGLLIMGILVGTGTSINTQRYRDSVTSLQSYLQKQYSEVASVSNDSSDNTCNGIPNNLRGQSDCVILGKYITTSDGKTINSKQVIGVIPQGTAIQTNDLSALKQYAMSITAAGSGTYDVEWGASAALPSNNTPLAFSMLILRSPLSGIIRTFISNNNTTVIPDTAIGTLLTSAALLQLQKICLNSNGLFTGTRMSVVVDNNSTSASGVETHGVDSGC